MHIPDKKSLKILANYHPTYPEATSPEDMEYLRLHGLAYDKKEMTHMELVKWALDEFKKCNKKKVTDNFLVGVGKNQPQFRAALSAYAIMALFPEHAYYSLNKYHQDILYCMTCGAMEKGVIDFTFLNSIRYGCGVAFGSNPEYTAFLLKVHNDEDEHLQPTSEDLNVFSAIIRFILNAEDTEKPTTLYKKIRKIPGVVMNTEQARHFLDLLGHAGILQTQKHLGLIYEYTNLGLTPSSSRSTDWSYPVDFWRGSDGINKDAFLYWFGDYPDLRKLMA
jgi:hypothetical protein